ncbi:MAG: potassium/proton antiporter [Anaerolineae bacterium]|nr:potassium/proton antiporter [Thermoflexales bacterium]MDW8406433.1 potassium/proton antiporter [Anaerolineae bacterium]
MSLAWTPEQILLGAAALLIISVIASKASGQLGVPALVLFLGIGMLAGSEGVGGIYFDNAQIAQAIGVVALAFILFSGGLDTNWQSIQAVLWAGLALSTVGVVLTAMIVALFVTFVLGLSLIEGLLLGAIVSSTDAAAVFAVLRSRGVQLKGTLEPLLELESGSNDPMAVLLTLGFTRLLIAPDTPLTELGLLFVKQAAFGLVGGYVFARLSVIIINRIRLSYDGLYSVLTIAIVLLSYAATAAVGGSGFLATYITGLVMSRYDFVHKRSLRHFHDGIAWLMQIAMFLTLGLLVFPSQLVPIAGAALLIAAVLTLVARPIAVFISLLPFRMGLRAKLLVSWVGLRGATPIVLATFPLLAGAPNANALFNLVFFVVISSVLVQGTTVPLVSRLLKVNVPAPSGRDNQRETRISDFTAQLNEVHVGSDSSAAGRPIVALALPPNALVVLIRRGDEQIIPCGSSVIEAGDRLLVLANDRDLAETRRIIDDTGPAKPTSPATNHSSTPTKQAAPLSAGAPPEQST